MYFTIEYGSNMWRRDVSFYKIYVKIFKYQSSNLDLRWAQLYVSLVYIIYFIILFFFARLSTSMSSLQLKPESLNGLLKRLKPVTMTILFHNDASKGISRYISFGGKALINLTFWEWKIYGIFSDACSCGFRKMSSFCLVWWTGSPSYFEKSDVGWGTWLVCPNDLCSHRVVQ